MKCYDKKRNLLLHRKARNQEASAIQKERNRTNRNKFFRKPEGRFSLAKSAAKRRDITWELTLEQFKTFGDKCHYCGGILSQTGSNLDRKDNSLDYTINNVVECCKICNELKSNRFTYYEMIAVSKLLKDIRSTK